MIRTALTLALLALLNGCSRGNTDASQAASQIPSSGDFGQMEVWKMEIMRDDRVSNHQVRVNGPSTWSTFFAPGGSMIRPGVGEIRGRDAIHESFMERIYSNVLADLDWTPERAEVSRTGDLGYTVGDYRVVEVDSAGVRWAVTGKYVRLWRRQADSTWKIQVEIRNPVTEPQMVPAPTREDAPSGNTG